MTSKNDVFGVLEYEPNPFCALSARYDILPDADELITTKNDVFGVLVYAPATLWLF